MAITPDNSLNAFPAPADSGRRGRPRQLDLSDDLKRELGQLYLATNATRKSGSMTLAWDLFTQAHPELGWDKLARSSKHTLPAVAVEIMRTARPLVGFHRGGERKLREAAYRPGQLRRNPDGSLLRAGQRASWDDATINFGVVVPWPWRGDACADKYGCRLGRFQLLVCHDDASSFVPTWSYVIRFEQSYRGEDVAAAMIRTSRDVGCFSNYVLEGGVWKSNRVQAVLQHLGIGHIDAQGRPQCKLVEKFFGKLWTVISALTKGHVGRFQAEDKATSELYVACRQGRKDPRKYFPLLSDAVDTITRAIDHCNHDRWESREYGKWVPAEVWERDTAAHPLRRMPADAEWLMAPAIVTRKVAKAALRATVPGVLGVSQRYTFSAPWLVAHEGRELTLYFDPLGEWPLAGMVSDPRTGKFLEAVSCANPVSQGGVDEDIFKLTRQIMRTEYRNMTRGGMAARESTLRALNGQTTITQAPASATPEADVNPSGAGSAGTPRTSSFSGSQTAETSSTRPVRTYHLNPNPNSTPDPLKPAADRDSVLVRRTSPSPATRDDYAAMRQRAAQPPTPTSLNW